MSLPKVIEYCNFFEEKPVGECIAILGHSGEKISEDRAMFDYDKSQYQYNKQTEELVYVEPDWDQAGKHLRKIRNVYLNMGTDGEPALKAIISPMLKRFSNGVRTQEFFNDIMALR